MRAPSGASSFRPVQRQPARGWPGSQQGQVAQSVEQGIENPRVGGSIPSLATIFNTLMAKRLFDPLRLVEMDNFCSL